MSLEALKERLPEYAKEPEAQLVLVGDGAVADQCSEQTGNQQIALSHGLDDNGQFQLNFQDERYLPFEYTGAVSRWSLTFPNPGCPRKRCLSPSPTSSFMSPTPPGVANRVKAERRPCW